MMKKFFRDSHLEEDYKTQIIPTIPKYIGFQGTKLKVTLVFARDLIFSSVLAKNKKRSYDPKIGFLVAYYKFINSHEDSDYIQSKFKSIFSKTKKYAITYLESVFYESCNMEYKKAEAFLNSLFPMRKELYFVDTTICIDGKFFHKNNLLSFMNTNDVGYPF